MFDFSGKTLEDLLNELKDYGPVNIYSKDHIWCCENNIFVKGTDYKFESYNTDLSTLVKNCLTAAYMVQSRK